MEKIYSKALQQPIILFLKKKNNKGNKLFKVNMS